MSDHTGKACLGFIACPECASEGLSEFSVAETSEQTVHVALFPRPCPGTCKANWQNLVKTQRRLSVTNAN